MLFSYFLKCGNWYKSHLIKKYLLNILCHFSLSLIFDVKDGLVIQFSKIHLMISHKGSSTVSSTIENQYGVTSPKWQCREAPSLHKSHWKPEPLSELASSELWNGAPKQNHQGKLFEERCYCIALRDSCGILIARGTPPNLLISGGPEKQQPRLLMQAAGARRDTWASFSKTCGVFFDLPKSSLNDQHEGLWLIHQYPQG